MRLIKSSRYLYKYLLIAGLAKGVLLLAAGTASAEYHLLHQYKHWEVAYVADDDPVCVANVEHTDGVSFAMYTDGVNPFAQLYDPARSYEKTEGQMDVQMDNRGTWTVDVQVEDQSAYFGITGRNAEQFLMEVAYANYMYIETPKDRYKISLHGSMAAIRALIDCESKLGTPRNARDAWS